MQNDRQVMYWMMKRFKREKPEQYRQHIENLMSHSPDWFKIGSDSEADYWEWIIEMGEELGMEESPWYEFRNIAV